jgi:hypothetical protein
MPALPTTGVGNAAAPNEWSSAPNEAVTLIGAGTQDTANAHYVNNATATVDQGYALADMPADFGTMSAASIQLRYGRSANSTLLLWNNLQARIMSGATVLAAADSGGGFANVASNITVTTPTNSGVVSFAYVNTAANKATWDAAVLEMRIVQTRDMGGATNELRVFAGQVTGTYAEGVNVPDAVDDLAATAGNAQVTLTWTAPAEGGASITDYVVQYRVKP